MYNSNGTECLWINVCFPKRKVYLYNEYECGGLLWKRELDIPDEIESEEKIRNLHEAKIVIEGLNDIEAGRTIDGDSALYEIMNKYKI